MTIYLWTVPSKLKNTLIVNVSTFSEHWLCRPMNQKEELKRQLNFWNVNSPPFNNNLTLDLESNSYIRLSFTQTNSYIRLSFTQTNSYIRLSFTQTNSYIRLSFTQTNSYLRLLFTQTFNIEQTFHSSASSPQFNICSQFSSLFTVHYSSAACSQSITMLTVQQPVHSPL